MADCLYFVSLLRQKFATAWCVSSFSVSTAFNDADSCNILWVILLVIFGEVIFFSGYGRKWPFL
jgi:hypothetical protein